MQELNESTSTSGNKSIVPIVAVLAIAILGYMVLRTPGTQEITSPSGETAPAGVNSPDSREASAVSYEDGTYTMVGNYTSPGGEEELKVTLTLENGIVTESDVTVMATRPISKTRQEDFKENYSSEVVGKSIAELNLGKVSGSSLTPKGFNDAVEKIKAEAKS